MENKLKEEETVFHGPSCQDLYVWLPIYYITGHLRRRILLQNGWIMIFELRFGQLTETFEYLKARRL